MWVSEGGDQSSSISAPRAHLEVFPEITFPHQTMALVPVTTLDEWSEQQGIARVDFLWLDMQGHELATATGSLNDSSPSAKHAASKAAACTTTSPPPSPPAFTATRSPPPARLDPLNGYTRRGTAGVSVRVLDEGISR